MAESTRVRVAAATRSGRLRTLDTVPSDTPARWATSTTLTEPVLDRRAGDTRRLNHINGLNRATPGHDLKQIRNYLLTRQETAR
jgi:hypothetical protein